MEQRRRQSPDLKIFRENLTFMAIVKQIILGNKWFQKIVFPVFENVGFQKNLHSYISMQVTEFKIKKITISKKVSILIWGAYT